jgi:hypothetical protein
MREIAFFVEDFAHQEFLKALVQRLADEYGEHVKMDWRNTRRGHGAVVSELKQFLRDLHRGQGNRPDVLIVGTDANCKGLAERLREISEITDKAGITTVCAVPDPHIERWLLADSIAFKQVFGRGCDAPDQKCQRDRYKRLLSEAIRATGISSSFGGMEFSDEIVKAMDFDRTARNDASFGHFLGELKTVFNRWNL